MSEPGSDKSADELKADIEATRAQLAETADALAAKLDVKAQADRLAHDVGDKAAAAYDSAKHAAPEPVQHAIDKAEQVAAPVVAKAGEDKQRTALIAGGLLVAILIAVRIKKNRSAR